jgi:hypothetical protein
MVNCNSSIRVATESVLWINSPDQRGPGDDRDRDPVDTRRVDCHLRQQRRRRHASSLAVVLVSHSMSLLVSPTLRRPCRAAHAPNTSDAHPRPR